MTGNNSQAFSTLSLKPALLENLETLGYASMTPIQAQSLPSILSGKDVIAQGQTGSGKTAAFGLGILNKLDVKRFRIQTLVLCPTRELADQVSKEIRRLARSIHNIKVLTICGGMPLGPQIGSLEHGAHIVVGTPGRIEEHLRKGTLKLEHVSTLVLDEADRMLDMGFQDALDAITDQIPAARQTLLLSATFPEQIQKIAARVMRDPVTVEAESTHSDDSIAQSFYRVAGEDDRFKALRLLLLDKAPSSGVVFCNTKRETQDVADQLQAFGFSAQAIHGDLDQKERDQTLLQFANQSVVLLVATDVAARGLDIEKVDLVVNYQLARDSEVHVHRIGRTGRAGNKGVAATLFTDKEKFKIECIEDYMKQKVEIHPLPNEKVLFRDPEPAPMRTLQIDGGKKQKVRAGDILGALTRDGALDGKEVGKIQLQDIRAFVAVARPKAKLALSVLTQGKMKGRQFKARILR